MKALDIAIKDLIRSFRSLFLLAFMFAIPLLVTGMMFLMFGGNAESNVDGFQLPVTQVVVADLDQGSRELEISAGSMGQVLVKALQSEALKEVLAVTLVSDEASMRKAVDGQQAGVGILIPQDFSAAFADPQRKALVQVYQDPALSIGPGIVRSVLEQVLDGASTVKIALNVASVNGTANPAGMAEVAQQVAAGLQSQDPTTVLDERMPTQTNNSPAPDFLTRIIGPIMGGMMIFFAFFTGGATAQTILREDEEGTLPRLFTTPTRRSTILGGKFLSVGLTVLVQVIVLLLAAHWLFGIQWGALLAVEMTALGIVACATGFGIFITSLLKTTRQGGFVYGGLVTATGMLGMMSVFTGSVSGAFSGVGLASLFTPQGWAVRGLLMSINGAAMGDVALNLLALLAWSGVFFAAGVLRFQKRFA